VALYAYDDDGLLVYSADAEKRQGYYCYECHLPVRVRKPFRRIPHFYHRKLSPSCRLYGKSQDHLLAQLAIQKLLPGAALEKPFPTISRIGDVVWEPHKLVFEIQCSHISRSEVEARASDYRKAGYQVVWILDDRIFNRKVARPAERWMRQGACYYATLRGEVPVFYDQFEIYAQERKVYRGQRLRVRLDKPCQMPELSWDPEITPAQVVQRGDPLYFEGDLCHRALSVSMQNLRTLELVYKEREGKAKGLWHVLYRQMSEILGGLMHFLHTLNER